MPEGQAYPKIILSSYWPRSRPIRVAQTQHDILQRLQISHIDWSQTLPQHVFPITRLESSCSAFQDTSLCDFIYPKRSDSCPLLPAETLSGLESRRLYQTKLLKGLRPPQNLQRGLLHVWHCRPPCSPSLRKWEPKP